MSCLYWIHLPEHTNIKKDGYVGITSGSVSKRWREPLYHAKHGVEYPVQRAIRKYGTALVFEVIFEGTDEGCSHLEEYFRNAPSIGWNIRTGGRIGNTWAEVSKAKASTAAKNRGVSEACRSAQISSMKSRIGVNSVRGKLANVYTYDGTILAENVCLETWCKNVLGVPRATDGLHMTARYRKEFNNGMYARYVKEL